MLTNVVGLRETGLNSSQTGKQSPCMNCESGFQASNENCMDLGCSVSFLTHDDYEGNFNQYSSVD